MVWGMAGAALGWCCLCHCWRCCRSTSDDVSVGALPQLLELRLELLPRIRLVVIRSENRFGLQSH